MAQDVTERVHNGYFVDLFVRKSNAVAINMYEKVGGWDKSSFRVSCSQYSGMSSLVGVPR